MFELLGDAGHGRKGDFFLDARSRRIYYVAPAPPTRAVLPQSRGLLVARGAVGLRFEGIRFAEAAFVLDESGYIQVQAGCYNAGALPASGAWTVYDCSPTPAAVKLVGCRRVSFANCSFVRLGGAAVSISHGSQSNTVEGSLFEDISAAAVSIGGVDTYNLTDPSLHDADNAVTDNVIRNVGREFLGTTAIVAFFSRGTLVSHNLVSHVPYSGISIGWGWSDTMERLWPHMPWDSGNVVSFNEVRNAVGVMGDGGSVYTLGVQGNQPFPLGPTGRRYPAAPLPPLKLLPPSQMVGNFLHDNGWAGRPRESVAGDGTHGPGGIYTDDGTTGWIVSGNVISDATVWGVLCYQTWIYNRNVGNFFKCRDGSWCGPINKEAGCPLANNTRVPHQGPFPPAAQLVIERAGPRPTRR